MGRAKHYWIDENNIINSDQPSTQSPEEVEMDIAELRDLMRQTGIRKILYDISAGNKPSAEMRAYLKKAWLPILNEADKIAVFSGQNKLVNILAQFFIRSAGWNKLSLHKTREEALKALMNEK